MFDATILKGKIAESSMRIYNNDMMRYVEFCGEFESCLESSSLIRWRDYMIDNTENSPKSINRMLSSVRSIMRGAFEAGIISTEVYTPFTQKFLVKESTLAHRKRRHNWARLTRNQVALICDAPDTNTIKGLRDRALLLTMATSGGRIGELLDLQVSDIFRDADACYIEVVGKRDNEPRIAPISPKAVGAIDEWLQIRPVKSKLIFTGCDGRGGRFRNDRLSEVGAWKIVRGYADSVGVQHVKPHDFRRYVGTQIGKNNLFQAQKVLGHKHVDTTYKYYVQAEVELGITNDFV